MYPMSQPVHVAIRAKLVDEHFERRLIMGDMKLVVKWSRLYWSSSSSALWGWILSPAVQLKFHYQQHSKCCTEMRI